MSRAVTGDEAAPVATDAMPPLRFAVGIEDTFIAHEAPGMRRLDLYELGQHYDLWEQDVQAAASVGAQMIRWGVPWYRVEPEPGVFDWTFPGQVIASLLEHGIEPIIDLMHYGTPAWLEGSFESDEYPERVAAYAGAFARHFGDSVRYYTPLNEPLINAHLCGQVGRWPPYRTGANGFFSVMAQLARGIVLTVRAIQEQRPDAVMVHVEASGYGTTEEEVLRDELLHDMQRHFAALDLVTGRVDQQHPLAGAFRDAGLDDADLSWFADNGIDLDIVGVNYYPDVSVHHRQSGSEGKVIHEACWGGTERLKQVVRAFHERYGRPIYVTETSAIDLPVGPGAAVGRRRSHDSAIDADDASRRHWLRELLQATDDLRADGVPVLCLTWWPLYDFIDWNYREGTGPVTDYLVPMGLFRLVPEPSGVLRRERLPVADDFAQAARAAADAAAACTSDRH